MWSLLGDHLTDMATAKGTEWSRRRLLMLAPHPGVPSPIPKLVKPLVCALESLGWEIDNAPWGRHREAERRVAKVLGRTMDLVRVLSKLRSGAYSVLFVHTATDWRSLIRDLPLLFVAPRRVGRVLLFHGSGPYWLANPGHHLFKLATRARLSLSDSLLLLSTQDMDQWMRFYPSGHFQVVANAFVGVDQAQRSGRATQDVGARPTLLFVGRLMAEKGVCDLLEAFVQVRSQIDCRLVMVGDGPLAGELRRRAVQLEVDDSVDFTGYLAEPELSEVYSHANVFVLPTYTEGFPTVILEAMSFGLPIVTTRVGGAPDHLTEGENALYVPLRQPKALADVLIGLLGDQSLREILGENNRRKVDDFAPMRVVGAYARVLDEVAELSVTRSLLLRDRLAGFKACRLARRMR